MLSIVSSFLVTLSEGFKSLTSYKERQSETAVLKDRKSLEKAVSYAEKLIFYIDENCTMSDDKQYQRLKRKFFKYN